MFTTSQIKGLVKLGFTQEQITRMVEAEAGSSATGAASAVAAPAAAPKTNTFYRDVIAKRVPCAYGVATCGTFAPNGVGAKQHTTCKQGLAALRKARQ